MNRRDQRKGTYGPIRYKTYETALFQLIESEFGYVGGPEVITLFVRKVLKLNEKYYLDKDSIKPGQMLWLAVEKNEKHSYGKRMKDTKLVPVVLTVIASEDIEGYCEGKTSRELRKIFLNRIYNEAYDQGGVLSESDGAVFLRTVIRVISNHILEYEKEHGTMIPRSGNIRDMGRTLTHKIHAIRNYKKNIPTPDNARMIKHSPEEVDRYIKNHMRVELLHGKGHSDTEIAFITGLSPSLVKEHITIIEEDLNKETNSKTT